MHVQIGAFGLCLVGVHHTDPPLGAVVGWGTWTPCGEQSLDLFVAKGTHSCIGNKIVLLRLFQVRMKTIEMCVYRFDTN